MYSQNNEQQIILDYFKGQTGTVLDIGANDGVTFSNSRALIERGWKAVLVEPSPVAYKKVSALYHQNQNVVTCECAIGTTTTMVTLLDSNEHCGAHGLVSTIVPTEAKRWESTQTFTYVDVPAYSFPDFYLMTGEQKYEFISIDAEGMDYEILSQMELSKLDCKMVCVEHNGKETEKYAEYCRKFGMKEIARNAENIIMAL